MTSPQARKGANAERELARILADLTGWPVTRRLRTGAHIDCGDLDGLPDCTAELKNVAAWDQAVRTGMADLEREQAAAGSTFGVVFVRRPGGRWFALMDPARFVTLLREATTPTPTTQESTPGAPMTAPVPRSATRGASC